MVRVTVEDTTSYHTIKALDAWSKSAAAETEDLTAVHAVKEAHVLCRSL